MLKKLMLMPLVLVAFAAGAEDFSGVMQGYEKGYVAVSGRSYPVVPDASALYGNLIVPIQSIPEGTPIRFELVPYEGASAVKLIKIGTESAELDELFPES